MGFSIQKPVPGVPWDRRPSKHRPVSTSSCATASYSLKKNPRAEAGGFRVHGAEGRTRTGTSFRPPPPQDGVSTKFHHFGTTILYQSDAGSSSPKKCAAASIRSRALEFVLGNPAERGFSLPAMPRGKVLRDTECVLSGQVLFFRSALIAIRGNEARHLFVWTCAIKNLLF
jgi:hypothetical protein